MASDSEQASLPASACPTLTTLQFETLERSCRNAKENAYCPYSKFRVGCAILVQTGDESESTSKLQGTVITGANVENAAYPVGTCAERVAIGWAVSHGYGMGTIKAIAVSTDIDEHTSPCGMCRQFISEFCSQSEPVLMFNRHGSVKVMKVGELLPMSFGPTSLAQHLGRSP